MKFEICVDSVEAVTAARDAGADRVELCAALFEGGLTPSLGMIRQARRVAGIGLHIIIRPRGGDFLFDDDEIEIQLHDIEAAKREGADGVVIGLLSPTGTVDVERTRRLISAARPLSVTFHRAFDMTPDPWAALDTLIGLGVDRVLTSGQDTTVLEGVPLLAGLVRAAGDRIIVMPGGGLTDRNIARVVAETGCSEVHFAALQTQPGPMRFRRPHVSMGGELRLAEFDRTTTSKLLIEGVIRSAARQAG